MSFNHMLNVNCKKCINDCVKLVPTHTRVRVRCLLGRTSLWSQNFESILLIIQKVNMNHCLIYIKKIIITICWINVCLCVRFESHPTHAGTYLFLLKLYPRFSMCAVYSYDRSQMIRIFWLGDKQQKSVNNVYRLNSTLVLYVQLPERVPTIEFIFRFHFCLLFVNNAMPWCLCVWEQHHRFVRLCLTRNGQVGER